MLDLVMMSDHFHDQYEYCDYDRAVVSMVYPRQFRSNSFSCVCATWESSLRQSLNFAFIFFEREQF